MKTILPPNNLKSARRLTPMELNRAVFTDRHTRLTPEVLAAMSKKTKSSAPASPNIGGTRS